VCERRRRRRRRERRDFSIDGRATRKGRTRGKMRGGWSFERGEYCHLAAAEPLLVSPLLARNDDEALLKSESGRNSRLTGGLNLLHEVEDQNPRYLGEHAIMVSLWRVQPGEK